MLNRRWIIAAYMCGSAAAQLQPPAVLEKRPPAYSDEARAARLEGGVLLTVMVGKDGRPADVRVQKALGLGLDENAVAAVWRWRFSPGMSDGQAVTASASVEVDFPPTSDARALHLTRASFEVPDGAARPVLVSVQYSPAAGAMGDKGSVSVSFQVNENGVPVDFQVLNSSDPGGADEVVAMIREWRFQAAVKNGMLLATRGYLDFAWGDMGAPSRVAEDGRPKPRRRASIIVK